MKIPSDSMRSWWQNDWARQWSRQLGKEDALSRVIERRRDKAAQREPLAGALG